MELFSKDHFEALMTADRRAAAEQFALDHAEKPPLRAFYENELRARLLAPSAPDKQADLADAIVHLLEPKLQEGGFNREKLCEALAKEIARVEMHNAPPSNWFARRLRGGRTLSKSLLATSETYTAAHLCGRGLVPLFGLDTARACLGGSNEEDCLALICIDPIEQIERQIALSIDPPDTLPQTGADRTNVLHVLTASLIKVVCDEGERESLAALLREKVQRFAEAFTEDFGGQIDPDFSASETAVNVVVEMDDKIQALSRAPGLASGKKLVLRAAREIFRVGFLTLSGAPGFPFAKELAERRFQRLSP